MLKIFLTVLTLLTFGFVDAQFNIFDDCIAGCEQIYEACTVKSGSCSIFEYYILFLNDTWLNNATEFVAVADEICLNGTFNGTQVICDSYVKDLIECIAYSDCWTAPYTTAFDSSCSYYAQVVTNVTVVTELSVYEICFAPWDAYFNNLFGGSYLSVEVDFLNSSCAFNYTYFDWNNSVYVIGGGGSEEVNITLTFELTLTFYSEYSYGEFIGSINGTSLVYLFGNGSFLNSTWIGLGGYVTECCDILYANTQSSFIDTICEPMSAPATTSEGPASASTTTKSSSSHHSSALSIKPFFNFMIVSIVLISKYIF